MVVFQLTCQLDTKHEVSSCRRCGLFIIVLAAEECKPRPPHMSPSDTHTQTRCSHRWPLVKNGRRTPFRNECTSAPLIPASGKFPLRTRAYIITTAGRRGSLSLAVVPPQPGPSSPRPDSTRHSNFGYYRIRLYTVLCVRYNKDL